MFKKDKIEEWARYEELLTLLKYSDWKVIVNFELQLAGLPPKYDPIMLHAERQAWRDEINKLEKENQEKLTEEEINLSLGQ
jgi:hypothetical protein